MKFFSKKGYTLIEVLIAIAILSMVMLVLTNTFLASLRGINNAKARVTATSIATEMLERIRNMPYDNIGTTTGWPVGSIVSLQTVNRSGGSFSVETKVDYIDDPFDGNAAGTIPAKPIDTVPTDYKRAEIQVTWPGSASGVTLTARFAPNGLETATNTGSLLITVFDSSGLPVPLADVHVTNTNVDPDIDIINTTDINGNLQLLSLPPDIGGYHVVITKDGYNSDGTQAITAENPQPTKADATIEVQKATEVFFAIDKTSTLNLSVLAQSCNAIGNFEFSLQGQKKIGESPEILKYNVDHQTDAGGLLTLSGLEWDNYDILLITAGYDIAGYSPPNALDVLPDTTIDWKLILAPDSAHSLLLTVLDNATGLPVTGASVHLMGNGIDQTLETGRGFMQQTDWSGGSGQEIFGEDNKYQSDDGNVDIASTTGQVTIASSNVINVYQESFTATTNRDAVVTTADWDTSSERLQLAYTGSEYEVAGIGQSITLNGDEQLITSATLTAVDDAAGQSIQYYLAADGATFEAVTPGVEHTFVSAGSDLRFRIELGTANPSVTPYVDSVSISANGRRYDSTGTLTSSTFDTGDQSAFTSLSWQPTAQAPDVGDESVAFQLASNNDNATWNFIGPDGTAATYYTASNSQISADHDSNRYIRYKLFLQTEHQAHTPVLSSISIGHTSQCTPPGQVFFGNLVAGTYAIDISHADYEAYSGTVDVDDVANNEVSIVPL